MPDFFNEEQYLIDVNGNAIQDKIKMHGGNTITTFLLVITSVMMIQNWIPNLLSLSIDIDIVDVIVKMNPGIDRNLLSSLPSIPLICYIFALVFNGVISLGESLFALTYIRNRNIDCRALYEGFYFYLKALGLYIVKMLFVSIGTMLLIFPGVIFALNFSQSFYILADNPEKGILEIMMESKFRMIGNRIAYINLLVSYLPYLLFSFIPSILFEYVLPININYESFEWMMIDLVLGIPEYVAIAYVLLGQTTFYELLVNKGFKNFKYKNQEAFREDLLNNEIEN